MGGNIALLYGKVISRAVIGQFAVRNLRYGPKIKITLLALPYNKHLINLVCSVRTVSYGSSFFPLFMALALRARAIRQWKKLGP